MGSYEALSVDMGKNGGFAKILASHKVYVSIALHENFVAYEKRGEQPKHLSGYYSCQARRMSPNRISFPHRKLHLQNGIQNLEKSDVDPLEAGSRVPPDILLRFRTPKTSCSAPTDAHQSNFSASSGILRHHRKPGAPAPIPIRTCQQKGNSSRGPSKPAVNPANQRWIGRWHFNA